MAPWVTGKYSKIPGMKRFIKRIMADGLFCAEVNTNWAKVPFSNKLPQLFSAEAQSRFVTGHNSNEDKRRSQYGGTCGMILGSLSSHVTKVGVDPTNLGRWS
jgi:hypothetical protein